MQSVRGILLTHAYNHVEYNWRWRRQIEFKKKIFSYMQIESNKKKKSRKSDFSIGQQITSGGVVL